MLHLEPQRSVLMTLLLLWLNVTWILHRRRQRKLLTTQPAIPAPHVEVPAKSEHPAPLLILVGAAVSQFVLAPDTMLGSVEAEIMSPPAVLAPRSRRQALLETFAFKRRLKTNWACDFGKMIRYSLVAAGINLLGGAVVIFLGWSYFMFLGRHPELSPQWLSNSGNQVLDVIMAGIASVALMVGFACELLYLRYVFARDGLALRAALALNLQSLNGSWWAAIWRSVLAMMLIAALEIPVKLMLPPASGPAEEFLRTLPPVGFAMIAVIAVLCAAPVEEIVFRGFVYQACFRSFQNGRIGSLLKTERRADYAAILASAVFFGALHMSWSAFPQYVITGAVLAWLYRRSGTLVCPILTHALNNLIGVLLVVFSS
jgi:membrane protease YdiL (CAAX protease family)